MALSINHELSIPVPHSTVWEVITQLKYYGEWNPFVVACDSSLEKDAPITMRVKVLPFFAMPQKETIFEHVAGKKLSYGINIPLGMLRSCREHVVQPAPDGTTLYTSNFTLKGWLSPVVSWLLGDRLRWGFDAMSRGIATRATALHTASRGS